MKTQSQSRSLLVVSPRAAFVEIITEVFPKSDNNRVKSSTESFTAMNGRAVDLVFGQDVVIIETDPDDENEVNALRDLLSHRDDDTVFLAMTKSDVSITKARKLRDIGVDEVLPLSIDGDGLKAVVDEQIKRRRTAAQSTHTGPAALGKIIPVTQARGGAGATTVAVNLACALAADRSSMFHKAERNRVVMLDFDLQFGNANVFLDLEDNGGFLQLIESAEEPDDHFMVSTLQKHGQGVDVLCAPLPLVPLQSLRADLVETMIALLKRRYDYIVIDLPRAVVDWVEPVVKQASQLLLVADTSVPCVRQARRLIDLYREENVGLPVEIVINRDQKPFIKSEHMREAEKVLETRLQHWLPDNPKLARSAVNLGRPIVELKPRSDLSKAFARMAAEVFAKEQIKRKTS
ncbi:AAA family ATPase [Roseovarius aestuariivivens]|uniref:AAA family ATPase n=1 Tax=Roseovarius aestuariivivens TaxID=1888910 RepID=UPI00108228DB|nr:AAA family ATPase [Roseovarius aestuariivivens]